MVNTLFRLFSNSRYVMRNSPETAMPATKKSRMPE